MTKQKILMPISASLTIAGLLHLKLYHSFSNKFLEFGNDTLIVILLLTFAEEILLLIFLTPFALYQKLSMMLNRHINESQQETGQSTNPQKI
ncbi:MAG: hypothetical protein H0U95_12655 [Bacteroidetes bacterium]|nr:hypothetical protein [Bacteroidota bacterium]